jgi:hypothetical protein
MSFTRTVKEFEGEKFKVRSQRLEEINKLIHPEGVKNCNHTYSEHFSLLWNCEDITDEEFITTIYTFGYVDGENEAAHTLMQKLNANHPPKMTMH